MHYIPFNSRKLYHKDPFGAVARGTDIVFRVVLPRKLKTRALDLVVEHENSEPAVTVPMRWECNQSQDEEWWRASFTPTETGLFFYRFRLDAVSGHKAITNAGDALGRLSAIGERWQLTVYDPAFTTPDWLKGGVFYQIFPDRFFASGSPKTRVPDDRLLRDDRDNPPLWETDSHGQIRQYDYFSGDLNGITEKVPFLAELGVTCLYLNPIFEAHSNHRYDTADYLAIDPLLGNEDDFRALCSEAHNYGIRVVLDGVFSHTGADSRYFNRKGRYEETGAYNSKQSRYYDWYTFHRWPDEYKAWWGIAILPELREDHPDFLDFITGPDGVAQKWLRCGASGWRLDVADELPDVFLDAFRRAVKNEQPDALILGEVWEDATTKVSYGQRRRYLTGAQLDSVMNYPFANALIDFVLDADGWKFVNRVMTILEHYPREAIAVLMNHIGTHDTVRVLTKLGLGDSHPPSENRRLPALNKTQRRRAIGLLKMLSMAQFTLPGVPCIYYGDEVGLEGGHDPFNRGYYPWNHIDEDLLAHYTALGKLRKDAPCLRDGDFEPVFVRDGCVAYTRTGGGEVLLTAVNAGGHEALIPPDVLGQGPEVVTGQAVIDTQGLHVKPLHGVIVRISER